MLYSTNHCNMPYIYLVHCRACINANEHVYKIGKSIDFNKRLAGYDKGTIPVLSLFVKECDNFERHLISLFRSMFNARIDYGSEYFEGDVHTMVRCIVDEHVKQGVTYAIETNTNEQLHERVVPPVDIVKNKKMLFKKLNTLHRSKMIKIDEFRYSMNLLRSGFANSRLYQEIMCMLADYCMCQRNSMTEIREKYKFGDYCEYRSNLITTISMTHDAETLRLIEAIKHAL